MHLMSGDMAALWMPTTSFSELFVRGTVMYLGVLVLMRLLRRQKGALNTADFVVLLFVADAAQNALTANYTSLTEGLFLVGVLFFWDLILDWLSWRSPTIHRLIAGSPLVLIRAGVWQRQTMRRALLSDNDVLAQLRAHGVLDPTTVRLCILEADGGFSVLHDAGPPEVDKQTRDSQVF